MYKHRRGQLCKFRQPCTQGMPTSGFPVDGCSAGLHCQCSTFPSHVQSLHWHTSTEPAQASVARCEEMTDLTCQGPEICGPFCRQQSSPRSRQSASSGPGAGSHLLAALHSGNTDGCRQPCLRTQCQGHRGSPACACQCQPPVQAINACNV